MRGAPPDLHTNGLRLLIGCRTAEVPDDLQRAFEAVFKTAYVADLAPLRRTDAEGLVPSLGLDRDAIVARVIDSGAGMLGVLAVYAQATGEADRAAAERIGARFLGAGNAAL